MAQGGGWRLIREEARRAFATGVSFPLPAYSEFMPAPYTGDKPYGLGHDPAPASSDDNHDHDDDDDDAFDITEYEQAHELVPGLPRVAEHLLGELSKLVGGGAHALSRTLLAGNPAWPTELSDAARAGRLAAAPLAVLFPLALSRTQDDKGNVRWTLFGASDEASGRPFWRSFADDDGERFARLVAWATGVERPSLEGVRVLGSRADLPAFARPLALDGDVDADGGAGVAAHVRALVTFQPFASLPPGVRAAFIAGRLSILPHPASLVFFEHAGYRRLAASLPHARQIPLLHLYPRVEGAYTLRIPQSGWLDEVDAATATARPAHGHRLARHVVRTHRWQHAERGAGTTGDGTFSDEVSVALFSTDPDELGLYGKPMARNVQIWREDYGVLLDGPTATPVELQLAAAAVDRGGRFGYRFYYPAARAGVRDLFWHLPLVARVRPGVPLPEILTTEAPLGYVLAEAAPGAKDAPRVELRPRLHERPGHREAARLADRAGHAHLTTCHNARKVLQLADALGTPLSGSVARAALYVAHDLSLEAWLAQLPAAGSEGVALAPHLRALVGPDGELTPALTFEATATRVYEEKLWRTIAALADGPRNKENADVIAVNRGRHGGPAARAADIQAAHRRDLDALADELHARYRVLIETHSMTDRAHVVDHRFRWETDFSFPWSEGWAKNQAGGAHERNIVLVVPGRDRGEAVVMADHYDTAYMEDVFEAARGGDGLRVASAGADDNHSATAALLLAAEVLLPLARQGRLARDVWLVHLTGEEFPSDCLGARALCRALVERRLRFHEEDGAPLDVSSTRLTAAFVLDMVGHNNPRDRDVFQIAPGDGTAALRLAARAQAANERWNHEVASRNAQPDRRGLGAPSAASTAATCRRPSATSRRAASCAPSGIRARHCTTPTGRYSPTRACPSCCSWRITTSIDRDTTTRTTRWRTSTSTTPPPSRPSPSKRSPRRPARPRADARARRGGRRAR